MEQAKTVNVAILGGGPGCKAIMDMILAESLRQLRMKLIGVASTNPEAEGYLYAKEKGIFTTGDYRDLYKLKDLHMIIELTGRDEVANEISRTKPDHVRLMDHVAARLFWDVFQSEEERIAERERSSDALRESEEKYSTLVENSLTGIYIDCDGKIVFANNKFAQIYRYSRDELIDFESWRLIHPEDRAWTDEIRTKRLKGEEAPSEYEARGLTKDGKTIWIARRNTSVSYGGKPAILGNIVEITDRKRAQEALRKAHDELDQRVKERTAELAKTNEELLEYDHIVAHILKAPLRAIHHYSDFLCEELEGTLKGNQKTYLDSLTRTVRQAAGLVDDLLEFSTVGRRSGPIEIIDIGVFLQELIVSLDLPSDVEVVMGNEWPSIEAEPALLQAIFSHLIGNAVKFNHLPRKRVELGWLPAGNERYEIFVRDNGIGIEPRYQLQIFHMFERLHTHEEYEGTGVGLAIVKKATNKLGGSVRVESRPGKRTTFFIVLPKTQKQI